MQLRLAPSADQDVRDIYEFGLITFGQKKAESHFDDLYDAFEYIASNPLASRERLEVAPPVRIYAFHPHLVIYRVEDMGVYILRILHAHQDWQSSLD